MEDINEHNLNFDNFVRKISIKLIDKQMDKAQLNDMRLAHEYYESI